MAVSEQALTSLAASHDIISIGMLADDIRRQRHGLRTTFVRVTDITPLTAGGQTPSPAAGEIRLVGAPPTRAAAIDRVTGVAPATPGGVLTGYSLADLEQLAARDGGTLRSLLEDLRAAGLELVAEAPVDRLQDPRRSIEEVNIAGLALARLTVHQSPSSDPMPLLKAVADLQRAVAVIRAFAPLPRSVNPAVPTTGYDDVKRVALARVVVDNVPSIQVDWSLYGPKLAQVALTVGADDIDGVSADEDASLGFRRAPLEEIRRNIRAAGQEPRERNGRFELVGSERAR
jgi:aminodeoxyfutalosine synthase